MMVAFIDDHRERFGVEPICAVLSIAPATYLRHKGRTAGPDATLGALYISDDNKGFIYRVTHESIDDYFFR
jgi:putative transposase